MSPGMRRLALQRLARLFDLATVSFTFLVVLAINSGADTWPTVANVLAIRIEVGNVVVFAVYIALCAAIFSSCGLYRSHRFSRLDVRAREVFAAVTMVTAIIFVLRGPLDFSFATNRFVAIFWFSLLVILLFAHESVQQLLYRARSHGNNLRNIVIVGEWQEANDLAQRLENDPNFGYRVLDIIAPGGGTQQ